MLPPLFESIFIRNKDIHKYPTRQSDKLHVQKSKTSAYQKTVKFIDVSMWNIFIDKVNRNCNIYIYKQRLHTFLLSINVCL